MYILNPQYQKRKKYKPFWNQIKWAVSTNLIQQLSSLKDTLDTSLKTKIKIPSAWALFPDSQEVISF